MREKREKDVFSFSRGKDWKDVCFVLQVEVEVGRSDRGLGIGAAAKTMRARVAARGGARVETQLVAACGLLPSLSSLYTLDTYVGA